MVTRVQASYPLIHSPYYYYYRIAYIYIVISTNIRIVDNSEIFKQEFSKKINENLQSTMRIFKQELVFKQYSTVKEFSPKTNAAQ